MAKEFTICCPRCFTKYHIAQNPAKRKMRCSSCGNNYVHSKKVKKQVDNDPLIGVTFGSAIIKRLLASGGMGNVYLAQHTLLDIPIAIKTLKKEFSQNSEYTKRFYREARIAAKIHHPHIVKIIDCGKENGFDYLSMEYVQGTTLRELVFEKKPLTQQEACTSILQLIDALEHASSLHIIHRDIKPANIMIDPTGTIKLADMGLARSVEHEAIDINITQIGTAIGTPAFMSPEQALDATAVDLRGDMYSLGATFYFSTSGNNPFPGKSQLEVLQKAATEQAPPLHESNPDITFAFDAVIRKMMAKKPENRYQTWGQVREAIETVNGTIPAPRTPLLTRTRTKRYSKKQPSSAIALCIFILFSTIAYALYYHKKSVKNLFEKTYEQPLTKKPLFTHPANTQF